MVRMKIREAIKVLKESLDENDFHTEERHLLFELFNEVENLKTLMKLQVCAKNNLPYGSNYNGVLERGIDMSEGNEIIIKVKTTQLKDKKLTYDKKWIKEFEKKCELGKRLRVKEVLANEN